MKKKRLEELGRIDIPTYKIKQKAPVVFVMDNIRSALNVGSAFRTADAFRIEGMFLCGITAKPPHKEIIKTAIGATASVNWSYDEDVTNVLRDLKGDGYELIGVEQTDESVELQDWQPRSDKKYALIFGNEVDGLSDETLPYLDMAVEIPQYGTKHSFNVSVSIGIAAWHYILNARPHS